MPDKKTPMLIASPLPGYESRKAWIDALVHRVSEGVSTQGLLDDPRAFARQMEHEFGPRAPTVLAEMFRLLGVSMAADMRDHLERRITSKVREELPDQAQDERRLAVAQLDALFHHAQKLARGEQFGKLIGFLGRHSRFSLYNNMLVYIQNPEVRYWDDADRWGRMGRTVKRGAEPLLILQPGGPFKVVYDVKDTEGPPIELGPSFYAAWGIMDEERIHRTLAACEEEHIEVRDKGVLDLTHATSAGFVRIVRGSRYDASIGLELRVDKKSVYGTLCHELAHLFLGHVGEDPSVERIHRERSREGGRVARSRPPARRWVDRRRLSLAAQEVEAEAVAFLICTRLGVVVPNAEYIANYIDAKGCLDEVSVEHIVRVASRIERMGDPQSVASKPLPLPEVGAGPGPGPRGRHGGQP
jgi:hypothetical protein